MLKVLLPHGVFLEIHSSTQLLPPSLLYPVGILVAEVSLVTLALGDILNGAALAVYSITRACIMGES